jgi:hypothetical protein
MKDVLLNNWNIVRFLRLGIGLAIIVQAIIAKDMLFGLAGLLFTGMALFNAACCGVGGCVTPTPSKKSDSKEVSYEEVV